MKLLLKTAIIWIFSGTCMRNNTVPSQVIVTKESEFNKCEITDDIIVN